MIVGLAGGCLCASEHKSCSSASESYAVEKDRELQASGALLPQPASVPEVEPTSDVRYRPSIPPKPGDTSRAAGDAEFKRSCRQ
jgi:hypothetical protein